MYSASVTAVFKMDSEGTEKRFTRTVQGSSSDYRINDEVFIHIFICFLHLIYYTYIITVCFQSRIFLTVRANWCECESKEFSCISRCSRIDCYEKSKGKNSFI